MRSTAFPDTWITESNTLKQTFAAIVMVAIGGILVIGLRHFEGPGLSDGRAGFLLGLLLLAIGLAALLFGGKQVIL